MRRYKVNINGKSIDVDLINNQNNQVEFTIAGKSYLVNIKPEVQVSNKEQPHSTNQITQSLQHKPTKTGNGDVCAPMPGLVSKILVAVNDKVSIGQPLLVMEAMKMENNITSSQNGIVEKVLVNIGQEVQSQAVLIKIKS